ncbi:MAG TPA: GatB/YqeY domain-containing protein [Gammaproteobacteria bacterium]|nr:GatB/YqeY domain-containing protein [Gammaproteobacteria bacterium]
MSLKADLQEDMKAAMRAGDKPRLGAIRLINAAIKQREVDERITLDDAQVVVVLDKMLKQRRESLEQYRQAGRDDLADKEAYEIEVIQTYLPEPLDEAALETLIADAIAETGASSIKDMGRLMGVLKPKVQGRADMGDVSARIKARLG